MSSSMTEGNPLLLHYDVNATGYERERDGSRSPRRDGADF